MTTKFFVTPGGAFVGAFVDGAPPPAGSVEVATPPVDGRQVWDGAQWLPLSDAARAAGLTVTKRALIRAAKAAGLWGSITAALRSNPTLSDEWEAVTEPMRRDDVILVTLVAGGTVTGTQVDALLIAAAG